MSDQHSGSLAVRPLKEPGLVGCLLLGAILVTFACTVNFPKVAFGFQSDEATYYSLGHSLARDFDFTFERRDLERVWEEFPTGPEGIFLKRGKSLSLAFEGRPPYVRLVTRPDLREDRLYYGKSYIYPLAAAPFVRLAGTNGFLLLHALLFTLDLVAAYWFLRARASSGAAFAYAMVFFFASAAPVYLVWLTPEIFNLSLVLYGLFLWSYKEVALPLERVTWWGTLLRGPSSDLVAVVLIGVATFSKPTNLLCVMPLLALGVWRRQWRHALAMTAVFTATVAMLFLVNAGVTGEFNYQGGDRNTFYGTTGFPFQTAASRFESQGRVVSTDAVPTDVLFTRDALAVVLPHNLVYFLLGRHTGLVPYFFPGIFSALAFLVAGGDAGRRHFQWFAGAGAVLACLALMTYMPFTYSGGGGPVGNRYFMGFYPLFLFLTPPLGSVTTTLLPACIGGLFTAQLVLNPFYTSFYPAEHPKRGAFRWLPVELSLINDLPVNVTPSRARQPLGGDPPVTAYFLDDNAYNREGEWFWVRGRSRAEFILRAPIRQGPAGEWTPLAIKRLQVDLRSGDAATHVHIRSEAGKTTVPMDAHQDASAVIRMPAGLPYRPAPGLPTNYVYLVSIGSSGGFLPLFTSGVRDSRYLGVMVHVVPVYE